MRYMLGYVVLSILLGGCTMMYTRDYVAVPLQDMSPEETQATFRAYRDLLISRGLVPLTDRTDSNYVLFRLGGSSGGFALRRDWSDTLELAYSGRNTFRLGIKRIVHFPADFSDEYLKNFADQAQRGILEVAPKPIQLRAMP